MCMWFHVKMFSSMGVKNIQRETLKKSIGTDPAATLVMSAPLCHVLMTDNYRL